jgi:hypothetical protein
VRRITISLAHSPQFFTISQRVEGSRSTVFREAEERVDRIQGEPHRCLSRFFFSYPHQFPNNPERYFSGDSSSSENETDHEDQRHPASLFQTAHVTTLTRKQTRQSRSKSRLKPKRSASLSPSRTSVGLSRRLYDPSIQSLSKEKRQSKPFASSAVVPPAPTPAAILSSSIETSGLAAGTLPDHGTHRRLLSSAPFALLSLTEFLREEVASAADPRTAAVDPCAGNAANRGDADHLRQGPAASGDDETAARSGAAREEALEERARGKTAKLQRQREAQARGAKGSAASGAPSSVLLLSSVALCVASPLHCVVSCP